MISITPIELAKKLFGIHHHADYIAEENPNQVVYKEVELIALLKEFGFPEPDFVGYSKKCELELTTGPWDTVVENMQELKLDYDDVAKHLGITGEALEACIVNKVPVTVDIANGLKKAFDIPVKFWLMREQLYRERLAKLNSNE